MKVSLPSLYSFVGQTSLGLWPSVPHPRRSGGDLDGIPSIQRRFSGWGLILAPPTLNTMNLLQIIAFLNGNGRKKWMLSVITDICHRYLACIRYHPCISCAAWHTAGYRNTHTAFPFHFSTHPITGLVPSTGFDSKWSQQLQNTF